MSRHDTCIISKNILLYENTYIVFCNGSWTPSLNIPVETILASAIELNPPEFGVFSFIANPISCEVSYSFIAPNTNQIVNRIALFKKDPTVDYDEFYRNVRFIPPSSVNINFIYGDVMQLGDKLYNPLDNTIYTIVYTDGYYSEVTPSFSQNYLDVDIIRLGKGFPLQTEAITPITLTGQQLSFKWTIANGNSPT